MKQLIIGINKMDAVKYEEAQYNKVKEDVSKVLKSVGFKVDQIPFVPYSAFKGDNAAKPSPNMPWYKGPTLLDALNNLTEPQKLTNLPLRLPVQDIYTITGIGTVPVGRVETGILKPDMKVMFEPSHVVGEVKSIEMHHEVLPQAVPGDNVGFTSAASPRTMSRGATWLDRSTTRPRWPRPSPLRSWS